MFSTLFEYTGKLVGELAHQTGKAVDDIIDIPSAFAKGYNDELFTATETPVEVVEPTPEPAKEEQPKTIFDKDVSNS